MGCIVMGLICTIKATLKLHLTDIVNKILSSLNTAFVSRRTTQGFVSELLIFKVSPNLWISTVW